MGTACCALRKILAISASEVDTMMVLIIFARTRIGPFKRVPL